MAEEKDLYSLLGVGRNASGDELKQNYRRLALKYHPDRNRGDKRAEEKFKEMTNAYQILSDPEKRALYDQGGLEGVNASAGFGAGFGGFSDVFSDIFEDFFGGGTRTRRHRPVRGSDLVVETEINFMEAVKGTEKEVEVRREETCRLCRGDGAEPGTKRKTCHRCHGTGQISMSSGFFSINRTCDACRGAGNVIERPCATCRGTGREEVARRITVRIPPGVDQGTRLRMPGEGEAGHRGGSRGDLYVDIFVEPHEIFKRHGQDVLCEVPISFPEAALGTELDIPTLNGRAALKIPPGTQTGKIFRMKGKGIPALRGEGMGDQHVRVVVETPTGLNASQKELLMKFAQATGDRVNPLSRSFLNKVREFLKV